MKHKIINIRVNGDKRELSVSCSETLLEMLRNRLGLTAAKQACGEGKCGACTVFLNGRVINSCLVLAAEIDGDEIVTLEGFMHDENFHPLQEAFIKEGAIQCGYCTPGMIISAKALLDQTPHPKDEQIRIALSGNLCRCTGYDQIIRAIKRVAGLVP